MRQHWQDWANLALGLWLVVSPWTIAHTMAAPGNPFALSELAMWLLVAIGILITIFALMTLSAYAAWKEWVNIVLGACLLILSWRVGLAAAAGLIWNALVVGALVAAMAGWSFAAGQGSMSASK